MIQIQELIKHFVLGIASLIICSITMAEINDTKSFIKSINEVIGPLAPTSISLDNLS